MSLPRLHGMPLFIQQMIEEEPKRVVYVERKRTPFSFLVRLGFKILIFLIGFYLFMNYVLPYILSDMLNGGI